MSYPSGEGEVELAILVDHALSVLPVTNLNEVELGRLRMTPEQIDNWLRGRGLNSTEIEMWHDYKNGGRDKLCDIVRAREKAKPTKVDLSHFNG